MKRVLFLLTIIAFALNVKAQNTESANTTEQEPIYTGNIDMMPEFKGGMDKFYKKVSHITYTFADRMYSCEGKVTVMMIIEKDGSLTNLKVLHGFSEAQDKEILRVIKRLNQWKPGLQNGKPVRVLCSIPIDFMLVKA